MSQHRDETFALWMVVAMLLGLCWCLARDAKSQDTPSPALTQATEPAASASSRNGGEPDTYLHDRALHTARVCFLEASYSAPDCRAIAGVAKLRARRQHRDWHDVLDAYSALHSATERATKVRTMDPLHDRSWNRLVALAERIEQDLEPTPCPRSTEWGSPILPTDRARAQRALSSGRWVAVVCSEKTLNSFFREVGR